MHLGTWGAKLAVLRVNYRSWLLRPGSTMREEAFWPKMQNFQIFEHQEVNADMRIWFSAKWYIFPE